MLPPILALLCTVHLAIGQHVGETVRAAICLILLCILTPFLVAATVLLPTTNALKDLDKGREVRVWVDFRNTKRFCGECFNSVKWFLYGVALLKLLTHSLDFTITYFAFLSELSLVERCECEVHMSILVETWLLIVPTLKTILGFQEYFLTQYVPIMALLGAIP